MSRNNKIIVTGLALGADADPEVCQSCNFDLSLVFQYPSTLLWADSIIITPTIERTFQDSTWPHEPEVCGQYPVAEIKRIFFNKAGEAGLFEVRDPGKEIDDGVRETLRKQVEIDRTKLATMFPSSVVLDMEENVPGSVEIEGMHYCTPRILSIYYSLLLADQWGAQPLLNDLTFTYLKYAFGIRVQEYERSVRVLESFTEIFCEQLPEIDIRPHIGDTSCWSCKNEKSCDKGEYKLIEKRLTEYLSLRDYDEVYQMKALHADLATKLKQNPESDIREELKNKFDENKKILHRRMKKIFPIAMRWSNLATILSIPVVVAGISSGTPLLTGLGTGIAGLSQVAKQYMEIITNKNQWLCFRQGCVEVADDK